MEQYNGAAVSGATDTDVAASSSSQVVGLQSMFKMHRGEKAVAFN